MDDKLLQYFKGDELASSVWKSKYATEGEENPDDMHRRMAREFVRIEKKYSKKDALVYGTGNNRESLSEYGRNRKSLSEDDIFDLLKDFKYVIPQGSVMATLGTSQIASLSNCFKEGTEVLTRDGVKPIEKVSIGDYVIAQDGKFHKVTQLHKNSLGERRMVDLKVYRTPNIAVTENHKFLSITKEQLKWGEGVQENEVSGLRVGDYIAVPKQTDFSPIEMIDIADYLEKTMEYEGKQYEIEWDSEHVYFTTIWFSGENKTKNKKLHNPIKRFWKVDEDFMYFLGLWYGDGCIFSQRSGKGIRNSVGKHRGGVKGITFTFNKKEHNLIKTVVTTGEKLLGIASDVNYHNNEKDSTTQIVFHSACVGIIFEKLFGRYSRGKRLNKFFFTETNENVNEFLYGLIDSDGCVTASGDLRFTLSNKSLVKEIYHLLRVRGIVCGYSETERGVRVDFQKNSDIIKRISKTYDDDRLSTGDVSTRYTIDKDGYTLLQIQKKEINHTPLDYVYTIGVEDVHSYPVEGLISMNCWVVESPHDSYPGIHKTDGDLIYYYKRRGGTGFDISTLRPNGTVTNNAAKSSTGAVSFMERFSNTTREVAMNGRK